MVLLFQRSDTTLCESVVLCNMPLFNSFIDNYILIAHELTCCVQQEMFFKNGKVYNLLIITVACR